MYFQKVTPSDVFATFPRTNDGRACTSVSALKHFVVTGTRGSSLQSARQGKFCQKHLAAVTNNLRLLQNRTCS